MAPEGRALRTLRLAWFDAYQLLLPRARLSQPALIVAIDEPSLRAHGQWPWPRSLLARLVQKVAEGGPAAIGLDIVMPEPDRLSPDRLPALVPGLDADMATRLRRLPGSDAALADALRGLPVVLGMAGLEAGAAPGATLHQAPMRVFGGDPRPFLRPFAAALRSVDVIHDAAAGHGLLSVDPEAGVVRRVPLVAAVGRTVVPALGLEMLRVASGAPGFSVRVGAGGIEAVGVGDLWLPTQPDGTVAIRYAPRDAARFVSAAELLAGKADPGLFARKLVIVGVTALATSDYQATPVADRMLGSEIHAQLLEGIFDDQLLARPRWVRWAEAAGLAGAGLLLILTVPLLPPRLSALVLVLLVGALAAQGFALYAGGRILFDSASAALGLAVLFTAMLGVTLAEANSQRRALRGQVEGQREEAARLAGELEAARRIQMGILPRAAAVFADERRVDVYAFLEPAREVGGDLYDFFRLDADRALFLIGDVSGKGLPGSLFMAVSKALYKSTALREGGDVAAMMRAANAEISRDNTEGLFVSVFAAILDARTGELSYCNAGHEPPYLLGGAGAPLGRLQDGGGPPLCVLDGFPYAAATHRLFAGESLCLVTDGVTEATNAAGEFYGRARLEAVLAGLGGAGAEQVGEAIRDDVGRFTGGVEPSDDLAILVMRWRGLDASSTPARDTVSAR